MGLAAVGAQRIGLHDIDTRCVVASDAPSGADGDSDSPRLRRYHKLLWSKPLPNGEMLSLDDLGNDYLTHRSHLGQFRFASDVMVTWGDELFRALGKREYGVFSRTTSTIGGYIIWPGNRVGGMTINGSRGTHPRIKDRFDLTIECLRRYYAGDLDPSSNPLAETFGRYADYFALFGTRAEGFDGFIRFFLLDDLIDNGQVRVWTDWHSFADSPRPRDRAVLRDYAAQVCGFVQARNARIAEYAGTGSLSIDR